MSSKEIEVLDAILPVKQNRDEDIDSDYEYTRDNLKSLIDKGTEALDGILELAKESDHPRAYEVVGQIIKTVSDTNKDLIELQKKMKDLTEKEGPKSVTNALFIGSTHELQKLLKGDKK